MRWEGEKLLPSEAGEGGSGELVKGGHVTRPLVKPLGEFRGGGLHALCVSTERIP